MSSRATYLDYNATAPALPEVTRLVAQVMQEGGNPSSVHASGRKARERVEEARGQVASLVGASAKEIIFTGGGTEANTLGLEGMIATQKVDHLVISAIEHPSILELARTIEIETSVVPVDSNGLVDIAAFQSAISGPGKHLVSIMLANNETGVLQPIRKLAALTHEVGALIHTDAIQAAGKIDVNFADLGVDVMSISAHKLAGPQGVGALVLRNGLEIAPMTYGGGQELGRRSGTENVAGIAGFGLAASRASEALEQGKTCLCLRDDLEARLKSTAPEIAIFGEGVARLPNTTLVAIPGVQADGQIIQMDLAGFAVSSGSACSSGKVSKSHVLEAMHPGDNIAECAMRISLGWTTTREEINTFLSAWEMMRNRLSAATQSAAHGEARVAS